MRASEMMGRQEHQHELAGFITSSERTVLVKCGGFRSGPRLVLGEGKEPVSSVGVLLLACRAACIPEQATPDSFCAIHRS